MSVRVELSGKKAGKNNPSQQKSGKKCDPIFLNATAATWSDRTVRAGKKVNFDPCISFT
jgi:hypothetical protein